MAKLKPDYIEWVLKLNSTQAQDEYHKLEKANRELKKENDATRKSMVELEKQGKKGSQEWKNLKSAIDSNNRTMADNRKKMEAISKQFDKSTMTVNQLRKQLKELTREFNNTSKATDPKRYKELQQQINKTREALRNAQGSTTAFGGALSKLTKMKSMVVGFFAGIGTSIMMNFVGAFKSAFNIVIDFERENSKLAAILGTTKEGIEDMMKAARELGATTSYSAAEVTQLQIELAKLGFAKEQIIAMEGSVLKFAKAVDTDLASASAFTGAALRIFGKDASEAETALASFAVATTKTALDFSKLETALSTVGPVAAAAGFSLEDTTALLGQLANAGFDASSAATATRNIILTMVDPAGDLAKALGGPAKNADELAAGLQRLQAAGVDLCTALELTDKRAVAAFQTFMENSGSLVELRDSITGVNDQFNQMADTMGNNVSGALAGLKSASEELILKISQGTNGPLKSLIEMLTVGVRKLQDFAGWVQENSRWVKTIVAALVTWKVTQLALTAVGKVWLALLKAKTVAINAYRSAVKLATAAQTLFKNGINTANLSMKALRTTMMSMPWTAIITAVTTLVATLVTWKKSADDTTNSMKELSEAEQEAADAAKAHEEARAQLAANLEIEKRKLMELYEVANDANASEQDRIAAINELNRICPEFNGHLDTERRQLIANKKALDEYIISLERRMRLAYYKDEYEKYLKEEAKAEHERYKAEQDLAEWEKKHPKKERKPGELVDERLTNHYITDPNTGYKMSVEEMNDFSAQKRSAVYGARQREKQKKAETQKFVSEMEGLGYSKSEVLSYNADEDPYIPSGSVVLPSGKGKGKGKNKGKDKDTGQNSERKKDRIKEATRADDVLHQEKLAQIEKDKESISEADYAIKKAEELIRYSGDLRKSLADLKAATKETDTELLEKIAEREAKIDQEVAKAEQAINAANAAKAEKGHADKLDALEAYYEEQEKIMAENVQKQKISQGAADIYMMNQEKVLHEGQLAELQRYYKEVEKSEYLSREEREDRLRELQSDIRATQRQILTDTGKFTAKLREMTENPMSAVGIKKTYELQKKELADTYEEMKKIAGRGTEEFQQLEAEKVRRLLVLDYKYQEEMLKLQEAVGLSWEDEYDLELLKLKQLHANGLISESDYQRKRLEIGINNAKKYFDFYAGLSGSMFQAIQDAEIAMSDAKYDALIRQAENNGEETAELEREKENKKLEIQKKYADVNFAIKVSQIVADTAVSIMRAFADLGPIGGAIAAALITATGVAQVISANAEREKVKKLQPSMGSSSSSVSGTPASATRVLSGFSEGGYTGDGDRYEVAGVVHKGEYVVPKPIMSNPRVVDAVGAIEAIRLNRRGPIESYANGGYTSGGRGSGNGLLGDEVIGGALISELQSVCNEMKEALRNVKAYVVLQELEKKQKQLNDARAPFTR